ncbi:MAG: hypothetical protein MJZ22_02300 [Candidatus Saccharibacteria bacterium]|nr:hypothetical protein [Candidatus Saccharibacteria bacterium]
MNKTHEVDVPIDAITDCLTETSTGKIYPTEYHQITKRITPKISKNLILAGWRFDWSVPQRNGFMVIKLSLKDSIEPQGMIALAHYPDMKFTQIDLVESAPFNVGAKGRFSGVGAHLFAIACKLSMENGNEGFVRFTAKTNLVDHYAKTLGAIAIDSQNMYIDTNGALRLIQKYFPEEAQNDSEKI